MDRAIHVWNVSDWTEAAVLRDPEHTVQSLAWSPDGKHIAFGGFDNKLLIWTVEQLGEARSLAEFKGQVRSVAWSSDGKCLAATAADDGLYLWDTQTWKFGRLEQDLGAGGALALAFTANGKWLASAGYDGHLVVHDVANRVVAGYVQTPSQVRSLRFSPDANQLLVGTFEGSDLSFELDPGAGKLL